MDSYRVTFWRGFGVLSPSNRDFSLRSSLIEYIGSLLKMMILVVVFSSCLMLSLLELFMSILSPMLHSFLILLSCHPFIFLFVNLGILFGPSAPLIVSFVSVKACSPLSRIFPFLCTIRTVTCSSLVNHS